MIESVEKMNNSVEFTSNSFTKMINAVSNLKEILLNYKISSSKELIEDNKKDILPK